MIKLVWISLFFNFCSYKVFSQDTLNTRAELGGIISVMGARPLDMEVYNKDNNLSQSNITIEAGIFYRKNLSKSFDLQIEAINGERLLNITDSLTIYRINDIYYTLNILPVLKSRYDPEQYKVSFSFAVGPSVNFLGKRKFSYLQNAPSVHSDLPFTDVITLAAHIDMGIKYNYTQFSSFLIGLKGSTDYFFLNNKNDKLKVKYNNIGIYVGFSGKIRKG